MKNPQAIAIIAAGLSLALSACSPVHSALGIDDVASGAICAPADARGEMFVAMDFFRNHGGATAEIRDVEIQEGANLKIVSFGVLSDGEHGSRGLMEPADAALAQNRLVRVDEDAVLQVRVALEDEAGPGKAESLQVRYSDVGADRLKTLSTSMALEILPAGQAC